MVHSPTEMQDDAAVFGSSSTIKAEVADVSTHMSELVRIEITCPAGGG